MANNIEKMFLNTPLTLILIILITLIIFCVMKHKLYSLHSIMFDDDDDDANDKHNLDKISPEHISSEHINIKIKEYIIILNDVIEKSKLESKEKFSGLTVNDLNNELTNLQSLSNNLATFKLTNLQNIKKIMKDVNDKRLTNKAEILQLLTNIYTLRYIEFINQGNAISYNEYNKYTSPKKNMYYKQYL